MRCTAGGGGRVEQPHRARDSLPAAAMPDPIMASSFTAWPHLEGYLVMVPETCPWSLATRGRTGCVARQLERLRMRGWTLGRPLREDAVPRYTAGVRSHARKWTVRRAVQREVWIRIGAMDNPQSGYRCHWSFEAFVKAYDTSKTLRMYGGDHEGRASASCCLPPLQPGSPDPSLDLDVPERWTMT
jgi:hypothetical protein